MSGGTWRRPDGGTLAYLDEGDPSAPTVLLLNGFPTSSHLFRTLVPMLAPMVRVIAPDLFGGGASEPREADISVAGESAAVTALLRELGIGSVAVVGHGHGGAVARALAADLEVRAAILVDAFARDGAGPGLPAEPIDVAALMRAGIGRDDRFDPAAVDVYAAGFGGDGRAFARALRALDAPLPERDGLVGADIPSLLIWGEDDPFSPVAEAERQSDELPGSTLAVLPGCSHFLPEDAPATFAPLVAEWVRGRYLGRPHAHDDRPVTVYLGRRPPPEAEMMDE